jgi:hypothetical protein
LRGLPKEEGEGLEETERLALKFYHFEDSSEYS